MTAAISNTAPTSTKEQFAPPLNTSFYLDNWLVLPDLNRLQNELNGESRSIEPRLMHLLCFLAANEQCVIDRDTLVEQLWPNVIVNENSLTRAVSELRKQLKDGCQSQPIETIPKKGYRLTLCTQASGNHNLLNQEKKTVRFRVKESVMTPSRFDRLKSGSILSLQQPRLAIMALSLSISVAAAIASYSNFGSHTHPVPPTLTLVDEILVDEPSILGGKIALSAADGKTASEVNEEKTTRPIVSYDGESYAYLSYDQSGSTIFLGALDDMSDPFPVYHHQDKLINLAWSPVGKSLLFARQRNLTNAALFANSQVKTELLVLDIVTGKVQRLIEDDLLNNPRNLNESSLT